MWGVFKKLLKKEYIVSVLLLVGLVTTYQNCGNPNFGSSNGVNSSPFRDSKVILFGSGIMSEKAGDVTATLSNTDQLFQPGTQLDDLMKLPSDGLKVIAYVDDLKRSSKQCKVISKFQALLPAPPDATVLAKKLEPISTYTVVVPYDQAVQLSADVNADECIVGISNYQDLVSEASSFSDFSAILAKYLPDSATAYSRLNSQLNLTTQARNFLTSEAQSLALSKNGLVNVAVISTGLDLKNTHFDSVQLIPGSNYLDGSGLPQDDHFLGTAMSSVVMGKNPSTLSLGNRFVQLQPIRLIPKSMILGDDIMQYSVSKIIRDYRIFATKNRDQLIKVLSEVQIPAAQIAVVQKNFQDVDASVAKARAVLEKGLSAESITQLNSQVKNYQQGLKALSSFVSGLNNSTATYVYKTTERIVNSLDVSTAGSDARYQVALLLQTHSAFNAQLIKAVNVGSYAVRNVESVQKNLTDLNTIASKVETSVGALFKLSEASKKSLVGEVSVAIEQLNSMYSTLTSMAQNYALSTQIIYELRDYTATASDRLISALTPRTVGLSNQEIGNAIIRAINNGAEVILLGVSGKSQGCDPAIGQALYLGIRNNVTFVIPAGDSSSELIALDSTTINNQATTSPACWAPMFKGAITVGNVDASESKLVPARLSNKGSGVVKVSAPAVAVPVVVPGGAIQAWSGTHLAAAEVTAAVAVIKAFHKSRNWNYLSPWTIESLMLDGSRSVPDLNTNFTNGAVLDFDQLATKLSQYSQMTPEQRIGYGTETSAPTLSERAVASTSSVDQMVITGTDSFVYSNQKIALKALIQFAKTSVQKDITDQVTWTSSSSLVQVSKAGVVSFLTNSSGRFKITATDPKTGLKANASVVVQPPVAPVVKLEVTEIRISSISYKGPITDIIDVDQNQFDLNSANVMATDTLGQSYSVSSEVSYALGLGEDMNSAKPINFGSGLKLNSGLHTLWITYKGVTSRLKLNARLPKILGIRMSVLSITDNHVKIYCLISKDIGWNDYCDQKIKWNIKGVSPNFTYGYAHFNTKINLGEKVETFYELIDPKYSNKFTGTFAFEREVQKPYMSRNFSTGGAMPGYIIIANGSYGEIKSHHFLDENGKVISKDEKFKKNVELEKRNNISQYIYYEINEELAQKIAFVEVTFDTGEVQKQDIRRFRTPDFLTNFRTACPEKKLPKDEFILNTQPKAICLTEAGLKAHPFAAGKGTQEDPLIVCTPTQLGNLSLLTQPFLYIELGQSLDFRDWTSSAIKVPARLQLNGNNYKIANYTFASDVIGTGAFLDGIYLNVSNLMLADFYIKSKRQATLFGWYGDINNVKITSFEGRNHLEAENIVLPTINNSIFEKLDIYNSTHQSFYGSFSILSDIRVGRVAYVNFTNSMVSIAGKPSRVYLYGINNEYILENFDDIVWWGGLGCNAITTNVSSIFESFSQIIHISNQYNLIGNNSKVDLFPYSRSQVKGKGNVNLYSQIDIFFDILLKYYPEIKTKFKIATPGITIDPKMDPQYLNLFEQVPTALPSQAAPIALVNPPKDGDQLLYTWTFKGDKVIGYQYKAGPSSQINCADKTDYSGIRFIDQTAQANFEDSADGEYTLCAVGITSEGLYQSLTDASTFKWKKNNATPKVEVTNPPLPTTNITAVDMSITGVNVSEYAYKFGALGKVSCLTNTDYGSWTAIAQSLKLDLSKTPNGSYVICLLGKSGSGKLQTNATVVSWNLNRLPPKANFNNVPGSPSSLVNLSVKIWGTGVNQYKYKLSSSTDCSLAQGYSEARSVSTLISDNLVSAKISDGQVYLCAIAGDIAGNWQELSNATMATWKKSTVAPTVQLSAVATLISPNTLLYSKVSGENVVGYKFALGPAGQLDCKNPAVYSGCASGGGTCPGTSPIGVCQVYSLAGVVLNSSNLAQDSCQNRCKTLDTAGTSTCAWNGSIIKQPSAMSCSVTDAQGKVLYTDKVTPAECNLQFMRYAGSNAGATANMGGTVQSKPWVGFYSSAATASNTIMTVQQINIVDPISLDLNKLDDNTYKICAIGVDVAGNWQPTEKATTISFVKRKPFNCKIENTVVNHGTTALGYQTATVPYGQTCKSESRTCNDGVLSGTFTNEKCSVTPAADCKLGTATIKHGASVSAFETTSVLFGQTCKSESRTCTNGVLSGTFKNEKCAVTNNFIVENGKVLLSGESWGNEGLRLKMEYSGDLNLYKGQQILWSTKNNTQLPIDKYTRFFVLRTFLQADGNLVIYNNTAPIWNTRTGGKGPLRLLVKETAPFVELINVKNESVWSSTGFRLSDCKFGVKTLLPGSSVNAFQTATVPSGGSCNREVRLCTDGVLSGSFTNEKCEVLPPADCKLGDVTIKDGRIGIFFESATVPLFGICKQEARKCTNGILSGSFNHSKCIKTNDCIKDGQTIKDGESRKLIRPASGVNPCTETTRTCTKGVLSEKVSACTRTISVKVNNN